MGYTAFLTVPVEIPVNPPQPVAYNPAVGIDGVNVRENQMVLSNLSSIIGFEPVTVPMVPTDYAVNVFLYAMADGEPVSLTEVWHNLRWTIDGLFDDAAYRVPTNWSICVPQPPGTHDYGIGYYVTLPTDSPLITATLVTTTYSAMVMNQGV